MGSDMSKPPLYLLQFLSRMAKTLASGGGVSPQMLHASFKTVYINCVTI